MILSPLRLSRMKEEPVEAVVVRTARKDSDEVVEVQRKVRILRQEGRSNDWLVGWLVG